MLLTLQGASVPHRLAPFSGSLLPGQLLHIVGPNGAGKSTLLSMLAGLLPVQGKMELQGQPFSQWSGAALAKVRAWLPQQQPPVSQMPVYHYLRLHCSATGPQMDERLDYLLTRLQLSDKLSRPVTQLSGGEWQRVRFAAVCLQISPTLNAQARLLIVDEPMTALDIAQQKAVDDVISDLCATGISVIASGHDLNHTLYHADSAWLLHQGQVVAQGSPQHILTPEQLTPLYQIPFRRIELEGRPLLTVMP